MSNVYVALENVRSLYNIGAIFRTCSFFGIKNIILVGYSGKNFNTRGKIVLHEEIKKSSLGSEKDLKIKFLENSSDLINFVIKNSLKLISIEQNKKSINLRKWEPTENSVLVFGNEVDGISEDILRASDEIIEIKKLGKHNSLNVTTTCGIILWKYLN
jgi:tRNA G18 (ribose-2'-O)-methylase SpoU